MSLVINTNSIASTAANNLRTNQSNLQRSLGRLSSGSKIVTPADDAGGLAVANKLKAVMNRNIRANQNVQNSISFLQVQDGAMKVASQILDRMSELKTMSLDVTKNSLDIENYDAEFNQLQDQLINVSNEKLNGINLFTSSDDSLSVYTTELGKGTETTAAVAQVDRVTITSGDLTGGGGATYSVTIDGTAHTVTEGVEINTGDDATAIATALATKIGAQATDNGDGTLDITASTAGTAQTITAATTDSGAAATAVANQTANVAQVTDGPSVTVERHNLFQTGTNGSGLITAGGLNLVGDNTTPSSGQAATQDLSDFTVEDFTTFIQNAATARARNGAQMQRLNWSSEMLSVNYTNVESAHSRLWDVDFAAESTAFAKHNILSQSATSMLAQANNLPSLALQLLS